MTLKLSEIKFSELTAAEVDELNDTQLIILAFSECEPRDSLKPRSQNLIGFKRQDAAGYESFALECKGHIQDTLGISH